MSTRTSTRRKLVVGNWKMHGSRATNAELLAGVLAARPFVCDVAVCVPFVFVADSAVTLAASDVRWGAQDVSAQAQGAYTGEVSAAMLAELGCRYALVGHSERRALHGESDALVAAKAQAALAKGVTPIVCVGETLAEREAGHTAEVVKRQLSAVIHQLAHCAAEMVVAYEPVWAIGTGRTATPAQAQEVHALLRALLQAATGRGTQMRILYGGSVKPDNAAELFGQPDIDGGLIGGASLKAADFVAIVRAAR
jgi:triosephosphate isomerase (TIM)